MTNKTVTTSGKAAEDENKNQAPDSAMNTPAPGATEAEIQARIDAALAKEKEAFEKKVKEMESALSDKQDGNNGTLPRETGRLYNRSKALHYVGDIRLLPDDVGMPITREQLEDAKKNPGFVALLKSKQLEAK